MIEGIYLLLGSNQGDRMLHLSSAREAISEKIGSIVRVSSIHESSAWGLQNQPDFLNQVIEIESQLVPFELLSKIQQVEIQLGRVRFEKWGPRIIDIDILYYGDKIVQTEVLSIPHLGIPARRFTLEPLNELAPDFVHPVIKKTNAELLSICNDSLQVQALLEA